MQLLSQRIEQLETQLIAVNESLKEYVKRLEKVERTNAVQNKDTEFINKTMSDLQNSIEKLIKEIGCLKEKPLKKYEQTAMIIISALIGSIITLLVKGVI